MKQNWITETAKLLQSVNKKTEQLLAQNLQDEEFHKRHQAIMDFWESETLRLQNKYPNQNSIKARPKSNHVSQHLTDKYLIAKMLKNFK